MKRLKVTALLLAIIIIVTVCFTSCGLSRSLVGKWKPMFVEADMGEAAIEFCKNGDMYVEIGDGSTIRTEYKVNGNQIEYYIDGEKMTISFSVIGDKLTFYFPDPYYSFFNTLSFQRM